MRELKPLRSGLTVGQLHEAEAEMAADLIQERSAYGTTLSALAHSWMSLDHQRESARMLYQRVLELRRNGRDVKTDDIIQQYAETKVEIGIVENQIKELLNALAEEEGEETALALLGTTHMNMANGIGVRFPEQVRDRLAKEADILPADHEEKEDSDGGSLSDDEA